MSRPIAIAVALALFAAVAGDSWGRAATDDALCGISVQSSFQLTRDISCETRPGLVVGASGITIDLRGHMIDGTGSGQTGIQNTGYDGVKIVNGTIRGFRFGMVVENDADRNVVDGLSVNESELDGLIVATGSDQLTLRNVHAFRSGADGISLTDSAGHKLNGIYASGNTASGLELINAAGVSVSASTLTANGAFGILAEGASSDLSISKTTVASTYGIPGYGIELYGNLVDRARLQDVSAIGNEVGIFVLSGDDDVLKQVTVSGNHFAGLLVNGPDNLQVSQATLSGNGGIGLATSPAATVLITKSTATGNSQNGFDLGDAGSVLRSSTANGNGQIGIAAQEAGSDGGKNTAHGNPIAECTQVACD